MTTGASVLLGEIEGANTMIDDGALVGIRDVGMGRELAVSLGFAVVVGCPEVCVLGCREIAGDFEYRFDGASVRKVFGVWVVGEEDGEETGDGVFVISDGGVCGLSVSSLVSVGSRVGFATVGATGAPLIILVG